MSDFFEHKNDEKLKEEDIVGILPPENKEEVQLTEEELLEQQKKREELFKSFTNNRFTEISKSTDKHNLEKNGNTRRSLSGIINLDALEEYVNKIIDKKLLEFEMQLNSASEMKKEGK